MRRFFFIFLILTTLVRGALGANMVMHTVASNAAPDHAAQQAQAITTAATTVAADTPAAPAQPDHHPHDQQHALDKAPCADMLHAQHGSACTHCDICHGAVALTCPTAMPQISLPSTPPPTLAQHFASAALATATKPPITSTLR